jgi:hypothetical protein
MAGTSATWLGPEIIEFEQLKENKRSIRYRAKVPFTTNAGGWGEQAFDLYVPKVVFGDQAAPQTLRVTLRLPNPST